MKLLKRSVFVLPFVVVLGIVAVLLIRSYNSNRERARNTKHYSLSAVTNKALPTWDGVGAVPLSPDRAVSIAMKYATVSYPNTSWELRTVTIEKRGLGAWYYVIGLFGRAPDKYDIENVHVLMNGEVWEPDRNP